MAELMVMKNSITNTVSTTADRGCAKSGDIVDIFEDGKIQDQKGTPFLVIRIPGLDRKNLLYLLDEVWTDTGLRDASDFKIYKMDAKRKHQIKLADLPSELRTKLETDGGISIKKEQLDQLVYNKVSLTSEGLK